MKLGSVFSQGTELRLGKIIGKGGEGWVYLVENLQGYAVKAYLPHVVKEREVKVRAMIEAKVAERNSSVAFPRQLVLDGRGQFVGFTMKLVEKHKEIHELQTPSSRQKFFPKANYAFLVRVAINIAKNFANVHTLGCVVGDINQRSILVAPDATVAFIDADSFQFTHLGKRLLCVVGVPEYTPPELQGFSLAQTIRTEDHDAFGLAVCVFQILCLDRHPFSGRFSGSGDMPLERAIKEYRFAYSRRSNGMSPPPGAVLLDDFTPKIAEMFELAFSSENVGRRPGPEQWVSSLVELEASLRVCSKSKMHHYARTSASCPWCRMETQFGRPVFFDFDLSHVSLEPGSFDPSRGYSIDVASLLSSINSVPLPARVIVDIPKVSHQGTPSATTDEFLRQKRLAPLKKAVALVVGIGSVIAFFGQAIPGILCLMIIGGAYALFASSNPDASAQTNLYRSALAKALERAKVLEASSPINGALRTKAQALDAIDEYKKLSEEFGNVKTNYDRSRKESQLESYLQSIPLRTARIPKVSSSDIASLTSFGFTSALDTKRRSVQQVYGIGPVKAESIRLWVERAEQKFVFQAAYTPEDQANIIKKQREIINKQQGLEDQLRKLVEKFRAEVREFERWKKTTDPELASLASKLAECEAALSVAGLPIPPFAGSPGVPVPDVAQFRRSSNSASYGSAGAPASGHNLHATPNCPVCSRPMVRRVARRGARRGRPFWGCTGYPSCTGTRPI